MIKLVWRHNKKGRGAHDYLDIDSATLLHIYTRYKITYMKIVRLKM